MPTSLKFPLTNDELAEAGGGESPVFFPASFSEYWDVLAKAEYRADYYNLQIVATMSYESELHSLIATQLTTLFSNIFVNSPDFRVYNSNRPVYIEDCPGSQSGVFNADGMVVALPASQFEYKPGTNAETTPILLVEVLSPSTRKYDLGTKLPCYKKIPSLQQILFVEQNEARVIVYEREAPNRWMETELKDAEAEFMVHGQQVSLKQVYRGVYFQ